jgi:circadian clock protein KaiC
MTRLAKRQAHTRPLRGIAKCPTGISGLDDITGGGLPRGRPTLVCGSAGSGKTMLAMEFLIHGAMQFGEPGVFIAFEEAALDLAKNVASLGFDLQDLTQRKRLMIDYVRVERSDIEETGEYDLEGLFIRLGAAVDSIGAKRVVLDTVESLFASLPNPLIVRAELRRLFQWLKARHLSVIITGEQGGAATLTRNGLEEYVSDCVITLDHRIVEQIGTRRLRIVKYRGSAHGTNEYPFLIDQGGFSVLPITSFGLHYPATTQRMPTGVPRLDAMLGGRGLYRGSSVLVSGTAGAGKSSLAASLAVAACRRGERCLYFAFEESPDQIMRNMGSIGLDLKRWVDRRRLRFHAMRPTAFGLDMHLAIMHRQIEAFHPQVMIVDPITSLLAAGAFTDAKLMVTRLMDFAKMQQITTVFTDLTGDKSALERSGIGISSLMDTWLVLRDIELGGERNRGMYVLKARGMGHSNQIREFLLTDHGIELLDVYTGAGGVLTGSARLAQEAQERAAAQARQEEMARLTQELQRKSGALESQIAAQREEFEREAREVRERLAALQQREQTLAAESMEMGRRRKADAANSRPNGRRTTTGGSR